MRNKPGREDWASNCTKNRRQTVGGWREKRGRERGGGRGRVEGEEFTWEAPPCDMSAARSPWRSQRTPLWGWTRERSLCGSHMLSHDAAPQTRATPEQTSVKARNTKLKLVSQNYRLLWQSVRCWWESAGHFDSPKEGPKTSLQSESC